MIGKTLGHYQIVGKLGEGGMGVVYQARDLHLDRFVALKLLPADKMSDPERMRRFVQEAKQRPLSTIRTLSISTTSPTPTGCCSRA
jgi:serine/threonine protein kinase